LPDAEFRRALRRFLAAIGIPMALGVGIYTGVLLGAIPARPFWNTPMVAMLFLFSALSTAAAMLLLYSSWRPREASHEGLSVQRHFLYSADIGIILLEILLIIPYILHNALSTASQAASLELILGGPFTKLFWIGFVGIGLLIPLVIEIFDLMPAILGRRQAAQHNVVLGTLSGVMVLIGGFVLRWVFVFAGQESHFG
jgi:formate-dependent nitrite reductase membrane component NrfD